jgi:hypothetical protein
MILESYIKINHSFKKKLIFSIGSKAGFFSEYNNMILAMIFCLENQIKFTISSYNSNFKFKNGWTDYFIPFCDDYNDKLIIRYNRRMPFKYKKKYSGNLEYFIRSNIFLPLKILLNKIWLVIIKYFFLNKHTPFLFTFELWDMFHNNKMNYKNYHFNSLNIQGDLRDVAKKFIDLTWQYNSDVSYEIKNKIDSLSLPNEYIGFHLRGGDKYLEFEQQEVEKYILKAESLSSIRNGFVLTDDYTLFEELQNKYPNWRFYTLCDVKSRGYFHDQYKNESLEIKRSDHLKLFASVDILSNSEYFIGTWNSNVGMYLGMRMDKKKCYGIDFNEWRIW